MNQIRLIHKQHGFYLFEILLSVTITGILLLITTANLHPWLLQRQAHALQATLKQSLYRNSLLARKLGHVVEMCGLSSQKNCSNNWSHGWFAKDLQTQQRLNQQHLSGQLSLIWKGSLNYPVRFSSSGRPDGMQGGWHCSAKGQALFYQVLRRVF